ncbi:MAG: small basic protein [Planctomycetota bacterium]
MSVDKSLKTHASLARHRNVLKRAERIEFLKHEERWTEGQSPFGLPKVANRKAKVGKKGKDTATQAAAGTESPAATPT